MFLKRWIVGVSLLVGLNCQAGPFGLEMGMTAEQLKAAGVDITTPGGSLYEARRVPRPHFAFDFYVLSIDDKLGLCRISAVGQPVATNVFGTQLKAEFMRMKDSLDEVYGRTTSVDTLQPGSTWNEPRDWTMGVLKRERNLFAVWGTSSHKEFVAKDNVAAVFIETKATSTSVGHIHVGYEFKNLAECMKRIKKRDNAPL